MRMDRQDEANLRFSQFLILWGRQEKTTASEQDLLVYKK